MLLIRRFRIPALACAFAVLLCELIGRPFTTMGVCDDGLYILIAQKLATTGHIVYNGNTTPILGWMLYVGAAFIKLFGFSFTTVRMTTVLVAMALAFVLQRTLVRSGITERNATLGTLALVLCPLYLMLSVTFMTDVFGLFAIVVCLYGCVRALQASTQRSAIGWLCFAVAIDAICGTSRQIAWLGILVLVPSTLWLLRMQRRVVAAGATAVVFGALFILGCMYWFQHQPYNVHEALLVGSYPVGHILGQVSHALLDTPFLLLPLAVLFIPELRYSNRRSAVVSSVVALSFVFLAVHSGHINWRTLLEPALDTQWINKYGIFGGTALQGQPPIFLSSAMQILLTVASLAGLFGLIASILGSREPLPATASAVAISWTQLGTLLTPYTLVYSLLLIPRVASSVMVDRYLLALLFVPVLLLVRYYQDRIHPQLPIAMALVIGAVAIYGIATTHNTFSLYRARVAYAAEMRAAGILDTSVDNGWEYNFGVELKYADHVNDPRIATPADAYVPVPLPDHCEQFWYDRTPHIHPIYGVSFDPNACYGPAPFAPVHYSRWPYSTPGTLYVVHYTPQTTP